MVGFVLCSAELAVTDKVSLVSCAAVTQAAESQQPHRLRLRTAVSLNRSLPARLIIGETAQNQASEIRRSGVSQKSGCVVCIALRQLITHQAKRSKPIHCININRNLLTPILAPHDRDQCEIARTPG